MFYCLQVIPFVIGLLTIVLSGGLLSPEASMVTGDLIQNLKNVYGQLSPGTPLVIPPIDPTNITSSLPFAIPGLNFFGFGSKRQLSNIWHLYIYNQIKLLSENKLIICAFVHLHYQISREEFELNRDSNSDLQI